MQATRKFRLNDSMVIQPYWQSLYGTFHVAILCVVVDMDARSIAKSCDWVVRLNYQYGIYVQSIYMANHGSLF